jgi:hypothetical protein
MVDVIPLLMDIADDRDGGWPQAAHKQWGIGQWEIGQWRIAMSWMHHIMLLWLWWIKL